MRETSIVVGAIALIFMIAVPVARASEITGTIGTGGASGGVLPNLPESVTAEVDGNNITINWDSVDDIDGYRVYRIKNGQSAELIADEVTDTSYTDSNLGDGLYAYQIQTFLGNLAPNLDNIAPTSPIEIDIAEESQESGGGGSSGGGGGGGSSYSPPQEQEEEAEYDLTGDGNVDILDFNVLMVHWGQSGSGIVGDINGDDKVDILDFNVLMINWS